MINWVPLAFSMLNVAALPVGSAPGPLTVPHFPDRLHAFVWRNWPLVPVETMAKVVEGQEEDILAIGKSMGLQGPPEITEDQQSRSYITVIRRNWHLLPYEQLVSLLGWTEEEMAYCLREDDFLFVKLGRLKPRCEKLTYGPPNEEAKRMATRVADVMREAFPEGIGTTEEPLFDFVRQLSEPVVKKPSEARASVFHPRYCYSYFALYGDPLLDPSLTPYPDGYLARLSAAGVDGVWLQGVLYKLVSFPWDETLSEGREERLANLRELVARAKAHNIGIYLYLNEPRSMPLPFFDKHPELKGVTEGDFATICTSIPGVQDYLRHGIEQICGEVPDLAGFFSISASENLTSCWSHHRGDACPRCKEQGAAAVISGVNRLFAEGISAAQSSARLIAWDWGWPDAAAADIINGLPPEVMHMSVSEWSIPIQRGGTDSIVGEYSLSTVGPGPRALRHWKFARDRGLQTMAKVQANNTWELSSVPYIPAVENAARHGENLRDANLAGLMLSWTLGGYPSPNLEVMARMGDPRRPSVDEALLEVAEGRFGESLAPAVVSAWKSMSEAFREYPYHIGTMYNGPQQMGPANLVHRKATGYSSTMVGFPYDDLTHWRAVYPPDIFIQQFERMAQGFARAIEALEEESSQINSSSSQREALRREVDVARACSIHFQSVANQCRFIMARDAFAKAAESEDEKDSLRKTLKNVLESEIVLAKRLHSIQCRDSRIGFEASNHYFYIPVDLCEKVLNCNYLIEEWLGGERID